VTGRPSYLDPERLGILRRLGRFIGIRTPLLALAVTIGASYGLYALATRAALTDFETASARITRVESDGTVEIVAIVSASVEVGTKAVWRHEDGVIDASVMHVAREGVTWSARILASIDLESANLPRVDTATEIDIAVGTTSVLQALRTRRL
jgi:hypothetical protein